MLSEKQLIRDCQKGIKPSQYELVKRYSGMLLSVCRRYVWDHPTAEDVLQESFIRIFSNIDTYKPIGSFEGWMRKITVRCALNWINKSHAKRESMVLNLIPDQTVEPDVYSYIGLEEIQELVNELPLGYRTVFNLYVVEGYPHKEIAELLDITESTSRSQLTRSKKILQKKIHLINVQKIKSV